MKKGLVNSVVSTKGNVSPWDYLAVSGDTLVVTPGTVLLASSGWRPGMILVYAQYSLSWQKKVLCLRHSVLTRLIYGPIVIPGLFNYGIYLNFK